MCYLTLDTVEDIRTDLTDERVEVHHEDTGVFRGIGYNLLYLLGYQRLHLGIHLLQRGVATAPRLEHVFDIFRVLRNLKHNRAVHGYLYVIRLVLRLGGYDTEERQGELQLHVFGQVDEIDLRLERRSASVCSTDDIRQNRHVIRLDGVVIRAFDHVVLAVGIGIKEDGRLTRTHVQTAAGAEGVLFLGGVGVLSCRTPFPDEEIFLVTTNGIHQTAFVRFLTETEKSHNCIVLKFQISNLKSQISNPLMNVCAGPSKPAWHIRFTHSSI